MAGVRSLGGGGPQHRERGGGRAPRDPEITDPSAAVEAAHAQFLRAGCPAGVAPADPGACVAAVEETRAGVTRLATGIAAAR